MIGLNKSSQKKETRRRSKFREILVILTAAFLPVMFLSGCTDRSAKKETQGVQADNEVAGFLYHFDQREETQKLVRLKNDGKLPVKVSWYYDPTVIPVTEAPQEPEETDSQQEPEETGSKQEPETTEIPEKQAMQRHEPTASSEDTDKIIEIYNALNNVIIVGNMVNNGAGKGYYITFTLSDGSECTFDFPAEGLIRLSYHNYSIETDGTLWKSLKQTDPGKN